MRCPRKNSENPEKKTSTVDVSRDVTAMQGGKQQFWAEGIKSDIIAHTHKLCEQ